MGRETCKGKDKSGWRQLWTGWGTEGLGLGCRVGGCRFMASWPWVGKTMTVSSVQTVSPKVASVAGVLWPSWEVRGTWKVEKVLLGGGAAKVWAVAFTSYGAWGGVTMVFHAGSSDKSPHWGPFGLWGCWFLWPFLPPLRAGPSKRG